MYVVTRVLLLLVLTVSSASVFTAQTERATVTGTVRSGDGKVVPGVTVTLRNKNTGTVQTTSTNDSGDFSASVSPGEYEVSAELSGFGVRKKDVTVSGGETARVDLGPITEPVFGVIKGTVKAADGPVLPGANVEIASTDPVEKVNVQTNEKGMYEKDAMKPTDYVITVTATGYKDLTKRIKLKARDVMTVDFLLQKR